MRKFESWEMPNQAAIFSLEEAAKYVKDVRNEVKLGGQLRVPSPGIVLTSGGFDPIHPGHISCIQDSKDRVRYVYGEDDPVLIVVVNSDIFLENKKGKAFLPQKVRCQIVSALRGVDIVVPYRPVNTNDMTVTEALRVIQPDYFTKGGDRNVIADLPEYPTCLAYKIEIVTGVGYDKLWSSSDYLAQWVCYKNKKMGL